MVAVGAYSGSGVGWVRLHALIDTSATANIVAARIEYGRILRMNCLPLSLEYTWPGRT
jgi:hypothetical protein